MASERPRPASYAAADSDVQESIVHEMQKILDHWELAEDTGDVTELLNDYVMPQGHAG